MNSGKISEKATQSVASMTGFGSSVRQTATLVVEAEVRSVNARYLDLTVKCPDDLRIVEPAVRERVAKIMSRGKVEVRLTVRQAATGAIGEVNPATIANLLAAQTLVSQHAPGAGGLTTNEILRWPGVLADNAANEREARDAMVLAALDEALAGLQASRLREGKALADTILNRIALARDAAKAAVPAAQKVKAEFPQRLRAKIESSGIVVDPDRLAQEIVIHAQRIDIDEEVDRLNTHLTEVERVLAKGGDAGKRLDFLMQELNREANTLGSKSADVGSTGIAIELKVLIEQMREQVQNLQ
jgi:uncharacterized protein (TIGR00255 family)